MDKQYMNSTRNSGFSNQGAFYKVKVTQEIPYTDFDMDGEEELESTGHTMEYTAGTFTAEHNARLFADALEKKIAEESDYITNRYTPMVSVIRVKRTEEMI